MLDRLLVVEDSPTQAEQLRFLLEDEYEVEVAQSGEEALDLISRREFDLVLSDVIMPGISGFELVKRVKERPSDRDLPVILLTSSGDPLHMVRGLESGADNYVTKPYDPELLRMRVRRVLDTSRRRRRTHPRDDVNVSFLGGTFTITAGKEQILDLLLSSIEDVIRTNQALEKSQRELAAAHAELERYASQKDREARVSAERYQTLMERATDGIVVLGPNGNILEANSSAGDLLGMMPADLQGRNVESLFLQEERSELRRQLSEIVTTGSIEKRERTLLRSDGAVVVCEVSGSLSSRDGEDLMMVIIHDITERKEAARRLEESDQKYRSLFKYNPDAVYSLDRNGIFLTANPACERLTGWSVEELCGRSFEPLVRPEELEESRRRFRRAVAGEPQSYESALQNRNGERVELSVTTLPFVVDGDIRGVFGIAKDITATKAAEARLRENERLLGNAERIARLGSWERDLNTAQMKWSSEVSRIFELPPDTPVTFETVHGLIFSEDHERVERDLAEAISGSTGFDLEYRILTPSGSIRVVRSQAEIVRSSEGKPLRLVGTVQDITEQKQTEAALRQSEEQLRQSQKMDAIGRLAGGVAHDFNNLLGVIKGNAQLLEHDLATGRATTQSVSEIIQACRRAAELTGQLLAFSRTQVLESRAIDLNEAVLEVVGLLERVIGSDIRIETKLSPHLSSVQADPGQMHQVLMNLAVNARDAMPFGGTLRIATDEVELSNGEDAGFSSEMEPGTYVRLRVQDTGMGMDEETKAKIFEPFFTTKEEGKGTGLGLATVYGIVKQSGGLIWVDSAPQSGSTFTICLPRSSESQVANPSLVESRRTSPSI